MTLENKLGIDNSAELANVEEKISKTKAIELFEKGILNSLECGTFASLIAIHKYLFDEIYNFAGEIRTINITKGNFRFAPIMYMKSALEYIEKMPQTTFEEIVDKYVEMNIAHPFREGNGRSMQIWLDLILKKRTPKGRRLEQNRQRRLSFGNGAQSDKNHRIKELLRQALTSDIDNREVYMKGIDASYNYEGYFTYKTQDLKNG